MTVAALWPHRSDITNLGGRTLGEQPTLAHFLAFVLLGFLVVAARWWWPLKRIIVVLLSYAVAVELAQAVVPGRTPAVQDGLANVLGVALGTMMAAGLRSFKSKTGPAAAETGGKETGEKA